MKENVQCRNTCQRTWENGESDVWEDTIWKEEWTSREKFRFGAENVRAMHDRKWGPKLMNCCTLEQVGTKEHGKMLKRTQVLEDGRIPAREARHWKIEGQKRRITRTEIQKNVE